MAIIDSVLEHALKKFLSVFVSEEKYNDLSHGSSISPFLECDSGVCMLKTKKISSHVLYFVKPLMPFAKVTERHKNIDTGEVTIVLRYSDGNHICDREVPRTVLAKAEIKQLFGLGIRFLESDCDLILRYLLYTETCAPLLNVHSSLGWSIENNVPVFKAASLIKPTDSDVPQSTYKGSIDLAPHGDLSLWLAMVKSEVLGNIPLTLCLILGFSSPLLSYLNMSLDLGSMIFSLSNTSSHGKTTSAMLAASVFSNPMLNRGAMRSFFSTANFLVHFLAQTSGITVALDEGATFSGEMDRLLYLLAEGCDKGRLNADSTMKSPLRWNSVIITTAEFDFLSETSPDGLRARCFTIADDLTKSAENADNIKQTVSENYGLAGEYFMQWLLDCKINTLQNDYSLAQAQLLSAVKTCSPLTERIIAKFSVISLTAQYVSECFQLGINLDSFSQYLLKLEAVSSHNSDSLQFFLDTILQEVGSNSSHFLTAENIYVQNAVGKITEATDVKTIAIQKGWLEFICKKHGLCSFRRTLSILKGKGILLTEKDRITKRVRLTTDFPTQPCYVFLIPDKKEKKNSSSSLFVDRTHKLNEDLSIAEDSSIEF